MEIRNERSIPPFRTLDGSLIREIFHPSNSKVENFSIALADVDSETRLHKHHFEEVYYVLEGSGAISVSGERREVFAGDCILIPKESPHNIKPAGSGFFASAHQPTRTRKQRCCDRPFGITQ